MVRSYLRPRGKVKRVVSLNNIEESDNHACARLAREFNAANEEVRKQM